MDLMATRPGRASACASKSSWRRRKRVTPARGRGGFFLGLRTRIWTRADEDMVHPFLVFRQGRRVHAVGLVADGPDGLGDAPSGISSSDEIGRRASGPGEAR